MYGPPRLDLLLVATCSVSQSWKLLEFTNNFHDFPNYGSGSRGFSKFMEIVGGIVGFTNNFHDFPNYGSGSRGFSKFMEIVGIVGFTTSQSWKVLVLPALSIEDVTVRTPV